MGDQIGIWLAQIEGTLSGIEQTISSYEEQDRKIGIKQKATFNDSLAYCHTKAQNIEDIVSRDNRSINQYQDRVEAVNRMIANLEVRLSSLEGISHRFGLFQTIWNRIRTWFGGGTPLLPSGKDKNERN